MTGETPAEEVRRTRDQLIDCALQDILAEKRMRGVPSKVMAADDKLALAARNHARAIAALEPHLQPKGWNEPAVLLSPECRKGQHRDCDGVPCEDSCHREDVPGVAA